MPPTERGRLCSFVFTGVYAGGIFGYPLGGVLTQHVAWQAVFYVNGGLGLAWCLIWLFIGYRKPSQHPSINEQELAHIEMAIAGAGKDNGGVKTPWRAICTSPPVLAICAAQFTRSWVFFLLLTNETAYLASFRLGVSQNGFLSAIPWLFFFAVALVAGSLADHLHRDCLFSNTFVRRLFTCGGFGVEGVAAFFLCYVENQIAALVILSVGVGFGGFTVAGWQINHQDVAPRFAGVIVGFTSTIGNSAGILAPLVVGALTHINIEEAVPSASSANDADNFYWRLYLSGWQLTFLITSIVLFIGTLVFAIWGSGETQSWALSEETQILVINQTKSTNDIFKEEQFKVSKIQRNDAGRRVDRGEAGGGGRGEAGGGGGGWTDQVLGAEGVTPDQPQLQLEEDEVDYEEESRLSKASLH